MPKRARKKVEGIDHGISLRIRHLKNYALREPLDIVLEADESGFLASSIDLPLYGYGDDMIEAIDMLKEEIENVHNELLEDNNFTEDWLKIKNFLSKVIDTNRG
jgi:predicted RNase H-like HicB family nuclease